MNSVVIEHVALNELPAAWQGLLQGGTTTRVTVRIEEEPSELTAGSMASNPLVGMWKDRVAAEDVASFARALRAPRFNIDGLPREN